MTALLCGVALAAMRPIRQETPTLQESPATAPAWTGPIDPAPRLLGTFKADEATQGVAVDRDSIFVIDNTRIGRYDRRTRRKILQNWQDRGKGPLIHMNGGIVYGSTLYAAHSNFPNIPMVSSVETFDTRTLRHTGSHSFGMAEGSLVWMDHRPGDRSGDWWVCFGHYSGKGGELGKPNTMTTLVRMDREWRRKGAVSFPPELMARLDGMTLSGGVFGPDGLLYCSGHHEPEIYVLRLPKAGSVLELVRIMASPVEGQGIALDRATGELFALQRKEKAIYDFALFPRGGSSR